MKGFAIRRIEIKNYMGVSELTTAPGPAGLMVHGRNHRGKSSFIKALKAVFHGQGIGPEKIRNGEDKASIFIDGDVIKISRTITKSGSRLEVTNAEGFKRPAPQGYLCEQFGEYSLDPIDLIGSCETAAQRKARNDKVLRAFPMAVTVEQLRKYVPRISDDFDCSGHALQVVEQLRAKAYEQRSDANKTAKAAKAEMDRLDAEAKRAAEVAPPDCFEADLNALAVEVELTKGRVVELFAQKEQAEKSAERTKGARAKVDELRAKAEATRKLGTTMVSADDIGAQHGKLVACVEEVERLKTALEEAERQVTLARKVLDEMQDQNECAESNAKEATDLERQANDLEATIAAASTEAPSEESIQAARTAAFKAIEALDEAKRQSALLAAASDAKAKAEAARKAWDEAAAEAGRLGGIVRALTEDAPSELLAQCEALKDVRLDGDRMFLRGVWVDDLSGEETIKFAVELVRALNPNAGMVFADNLERLDPVEMESFQREATRDGWILFGSCVDANGELQYTAIMRESANDQAAE